MVDINRRYVLRLKSAAGSVNLVFLGILGAFILALAIPYLIDIGNSNYQKTREFCVKASFYASQGISDPQADSEAALAEEGDGWCGTTRVMPD